MTTLPNPNDAPIIQKAMDRIFKRDEQLGFTDVRLLEHFQGHAHRVMETTVNTVSRFTGLSVNIPDPVARRIVAQGGTHLLSMDIEGQTRKALFQGLAESRAAGYHPSSAATRRLIQRHVTAGRFTKMVDRYGRPNGHIYRAKLIARTETMYAQNESAFATYEASDAIQQGEIIDNQTGFDDADCMARNGFVGPLDECRRHIAEEHPQGTARVLPVLKEDMVVEQPSPEPLPKPVTPKPVTPKPVPEPSPVTSLVDERGGPRRALRPPDPIERDEFANLSDYVDDHKHVGLRDYTGFGNAYKNYNASLRSGTKLTKAQQRISSDFAKLGKRNDSLTGRRLFRGESRPTDFNLKVGDVVTNAAPQSTSMNFTNASTFTRATEGNKKGIIKNVTHSR